MEGDSGKGWNGPVGGLQAGQLSTTDQASEAEDHPILRIIGAKDLLNTAWAGMRIDLNRNGRPETVDLNPRAQLLA